MSIERDKEIVFHEEGTLNAVTRWISSHDEGIAEWLKNARRAYQPDRGNVADADRVAVILLKDSDKHGAARIGFWTLALALQQMRVYAIQNGITLYEGKPLTLEAIPPYPGVEGPFIHPIPAELPDDDGVAQSTTQGGTKEPGRLILFTSKDNMPGRHKVLKPRWKLSYRAGHQMLGSKIMSEIAPATPGVEFIFGQVELEALSAYVHHGRTMPKDGPLVQAVDVFVAKKVRELAKEINERRRHRQDNDQLDQVRRENELLNKFKNKFMPTDGAGGNGNRGVGGPGPEPPPPPPPPPPTGEVPSIIEFGWPDDQVLRVGKGVAVRVATILKTRVRDEQERLVPGVDLEWIIDDVQVARIEAGVLKARHSGKCHMYARVPGTMIRSKSVTVEVWVVDHVLLSPRSLEVLLGKRADITAEVTNDRGERSTEVLLEWKHDADDNLIVRLNPFWSGFWEQSRNDEHQRWGRRSTG